MGWLAAAAVAVPPVLDRVPDNAMFVIAAPSADAVQKNVQALVTATELPIAMLPKVEDLLAMAGITEGLDTTKSFALVGFAPVAGDKGKLPVAVEKAKGGEEPAVDIQPTEGEEDRVVVLLPTTSYEGLLKNFDAKPDAAGGITSVTMPDGNDGFVKDVGNGYVAVSPVKSLLEGFDANAGAAAIKGKLGKAGTSLADTGDLVVIANMDQVRPLWPEIKKKMAEKIEEGAAGLPMGEAPNPMENPVGDFVIESLIRDGRAMVITVRTGSTGVKLDMAASFTDGSPMAKVFTGSASAGKLLAKLPSTPYLFAGAMDLTGTGVKSFVQEATAKMPAGGGGVPGIGLEGTMKQLQDSEGASFVLGVPPGGIMAGLTTGTIYYAATKDPAGHVAAQKKVLTELNGKAQEGVKFTTTYKDAAQKVENLDVDEYTMKITPDLDSDEAQMGAQMMNGLFGPSGGPAGFIAKTDTGVYQTMGRNSALLASALKTSAGGESLGGDKMLAQVGEGMPGNRIAEGYIGTQGLLDVALPFAAMFMGVQIPPEQIPTNLPPVGMSLAGAEGSAHVSLFVPAPVIATGVKIATTIQQQMEGEFGEGEGEEAPAGDKGKTGQPKF